MAFSFDDLREKVTDLAQSGVAKSKQLAEIAKLKTSNMGEEDTIKKATWSWAGCTTRSGAPPRRGPMPPPADGSARLRRPLRPTTPALRS